MNVACIPQKAIYRMGRLQQQEATQWTLLVKIEGGREDHLSAELCLWNYTQKDPRVFLNK